MKTVWPWKGGGGERAGTLISQAILAGAAASMAVRIGGVVLSYSANVLLSRLLGLSGYGQYVIVLSWVLVLILPARAGFDNSALRYSSIYFEGGEAGSLRGFIRFATGCVIAVSLVIAAATAVFGPGFIRAGEAAVWWGAAMVLPLALITVYSVMLRTARRIIAAQMYEQVVRPIVVLLAIGLFALVKFPLTAASAMFITCVGAYVAFAALLIHFRAVFGRATRAPPQYDKWREWFAVSVPLLLMGVLQELLNQVDILLLGVLADERQAALFAASWRIASFIPFALIALATMAGPMIAAAFHRGAMAELSQISKMVARVGFAFALAGSLALLVAGKWLLGVFGGEFSVAYPVLLVLVAGGIVNAFTGVVAYFMTMTGHERQAVVIFAGALLLSVTLNLVLIPRFGALGSAAASSSALAVYNLAMLFYVRRTIGIDASALALKRRERA